MNVMTTLLVIDGDPTVFQMLTGAFACGEEYVVTATDGPTGLALAQREMPDLVLLELVLPGLNGYTVCRTLRERSTVPIIILSSVQDELHRIASFALGANDVVSKPCALGELVARVRSQLYWHGHRQVQQPFVEGPLLEAESLRVDVARRSVWCDDQEVVLTHKEFELLVALMQHPNCVLSRNQLLEQIWPDPISSDPRTIDVHIHSLRAKITASASGPSCIQTVRGVGYRFHQAHQTCAC